MSIEFKRDDDIPRIKGHANRDGAGYFLTNANEAWMRAARYLELYERGKVTQLLAELDRDTTDSAIHPQAVALMLVRLAAVMGRVGGRNASRVALAFSRLANTDLEIKDNDSKKLWLPS